MNILFIIGRILFGGFFLYNGINHFLHAGMLAGYAGSRGVPSPHAAVIIAGIFLIIGGASVILGLFPAIGLICLVVFLIPVSFSMHSFWTDTDPAMRQANVVNFTKNMALLGATLMMFVISRPWPWSVLGRRL